MNRAMPTDTTATEGKNMTIVVATADAGSIHALITRLRCEPGVALHQAASGSAALVLIKGTNPDLVIAGEQLEDMSGLDFIKRLVAIAPLANTALVGSLPAEDFHEVTEGLGVLMQLPPAPDGTDAEALLSVLARIRGLLAAPAPAAS